jgi:AcrR family transcriptional regulator
MAPRPEASLRLVLPVKERGRRRSQAERAAGTRARIIAAVVESVADVGFSRTTAAEVTRRAGVTWGAVQHHFGGKDGLLVAVLEDSFDHFAEGLVEVDVEGVSLEKRASLFVDRAWSHFASTEYHSTFEILLHYLRREDLRAEAAEGGWQTQMSQAWERVWMRLFGDAPLPLRQQRMLQHYTISVLSGLASTLMLEGPGARLREPELDLLKQTLARELTHAA